ncbi:MAG: hypothetical protein WD794_06230 [Mycobacteriales bacterium]
MRALVLGVSVLALLTLYVTWTAGRLDRLHARVDASWAALDAQLVRRAAAARAVAAHLDDPETGRTLAQAASASLEGTVDRREGLENDLSRALKVSLPLLVQDAAGEAARAELETASTRVGLARSFHNAAVRDTREIRLRRLPRALRLAGHRELPGYFEIDDTGS